jgi:hypothetical protein
VSLSVTAGRGADMLGSCTLLRPGNREGTGAGSASTFRERDRLPEPGPLDDSGAGTLPPDPDHPSLQASDWQPAIQEPSSSAHTRPPDMHCQRAVQELLEARADAITWRIPL